MPRVDDTESRPTIQQLQAEHEELVESHRRLMKELESIEGTGFDSSIRAAYLKQLHQHLEALRKHHEAIHAHHQALDARHEALHERHKAAAASKPK